MNQLTKIFKKIIGNLEGDCIANSRNYDKKLCELTNGILVHENKHYWDATCGKFYIENKKCKGSMWFNLVRYAKIYLQVDEESKIKTYTVVYKYTGRKVIEILIIDTRILMNRLLKGYIETDSVKKFYDMCKLCDLSSHFQVQLSYKQMKELAGSIVVSAS
jgi:hypothetical protein